MADDNLTAEQAIAESILRDDIVTIDHSLEAMLYLRSLCEYYTVCAEGRQFDGGDELARDNWTVIVRHPRATP